MVVRAVRQETSEQIDVRATITPGATTPVNLIFSGTATVVGRVIYPNGQAAAGVAVVGGTTQVSTDANGNFVIARIGVGHQTLLAANESAGTEASAVVDIGAPGIVVPVTIVLPAAAASAAACSTPVDRRSVKPRSFSGSAATASCAPPRQ